MKIALAATAVVLIAGAAHAAPLEAYGKLPSMDMVTISPDGAKVAFVQEVSGKQAVVVDQLSPSAVISELPPTGQKVRALIWADPTHLLVVKSQAGYAGREVQSNLTEFVTVQSFDLVKRKVTPLFGKDLSTSQLRTTSSATTLNAISGQPQVRTVKGHTVVFARGVLFVDSRSAPALISSDLTSGEEALVDSAHSSDQGRQWILDDQGVPVAQVTYDEGIQTWTLRLKRDSSFVEAYSVKAPNDQPSVRGFSPDGASLVLQTIRDDGAAEYHLVSLADGKLGPAISQYDAYSTMIDDPVTQHLIGGVKMAMEPTYTFFDPKDQAAWNAVTATYAGEQVDPVSWSNDRSKIVVRVTGIKHGVEYAIIDLAAHKAMDVGPVYADIKPDDLADVALAAYPAKDGLKIDAFLTLPIGREPKNLPLIVLTHGGPAARDEIGFDWWAQALASRGYAVLQPQFRGSAGFGWKLESSGFGEFGRKMQSDLSDGVRALAAKGYIDPKRVCIVGASYGGYAALAGVTLEQGVYRCAVAVAGVSDMRDMVGRGLVDASRSSTVRYWDRFVGAKGPTDPVFDEISPVRHAAQASVPILLVHGKDDTVVPFSQSTKMETALKSANKPVEFVTLDREDHWLSREETREQMLKATVSFLEKNNPPQ